LVTLLVGIGLMLIELHAAGKVHGSMHPAHVGLDERGRPMLRQASAPDGWTQRDDVLALLRLGASLARPASSIATELRAYATGGELALDRLVPWLFRLAAPAPLPTCC
jgi:hypothetical protein